MSKRQNDAFPKIPDNTIASLRNEIFSHCSKKGGYLASDLSSTTMIVVLSSFIEKDSELYLCEGHHDLYPVMKEVFPEMNIGSCSLAYAYGRAKKRDRVAPRKKIFIYLDSKDLTAENREVLKQIASYDRQLVLFVHEYNHGNRHRNLLKKGISSIGNTSAYNNLKTGIKNTLTPMKHGEEIIHSIHTAKSSLKKAVWNERIFRELDLDCYGPYDGNDPKEVFLSLNSLSFPDHPIVMHYICEERNVPEKYKDLFKTGYTEAFDLNTGKRKLVETETFSHSSSFFSKEISRMMAADPSIRFLDNGDSDRFLSLSASHPDRYERYDLPIHELLQTAIGSSCQDTSIFLAIDSDAFFHEIDLLKDLADRIEGRFLLAVSHDEDRDLSPAADLKDWMIYLAKDAGDIIRKTAEYQDHKRPFILIYPDRFLELEKDSKIEDSDLGIARFAVNNKKGKKAVIAQGSDYVQLKKIITENKSEIDLYRIGFLSPFPENEFSMILNAYETIYVYHSCLERFIRDQVNIHRNGSVVQYLGKEELPLLFEEQP